MRKRKRFLSAVLVLCLLMGLLPSAALAAGKSTPFSDVASDSWFYESVEYVYENNLMGYTTGTLFSPGENTTRGMLVTILHRMEGEPAAVGGSFSDVAPGQWYSSAVAWASANGIVNGYDDGRFGPADSITREQAAAILYRYAQHKGFAGQVSGSLSAFPDAGQVSGYAMEAMIWAVRNGLITGLDDGTLAPGGSAVRAQIAVILARFHQQVEASAPKPQETPVPSATPAPTPTPRPTPTPKPSSQPSGSGNSGGYGGKIEGGASSSGGSTSTPTPTPTPSGFTARITGDARPGQQLTATPSGSGYTIEWLVDGEPVEGATGATYTVKSADAGATITARITYGETVKTSNGLKVSGTLEEYDVLDTDRDRDPVAFEGDVTYKKENEDGTYSDYEVTADAQISLEIKPSNAPIENEPGNEEVANALALAIKNGGVGEVDENAVAEKIRELMESGDPLNITYSAVDVDLVLTETTTDEAGETTTEKTPLHAVGKTVVTLTRAALGIPDGDKLEDYTFFAVHTNVNGEEEVVEGVVVNGAYVRFELNGLSRIFVGNVPPLTVTFDTDGGEPVPPAQKVKLGGYAKYVEPPLKENWLFAGWDHDIETENLFKNIKVTALWIQGTTAADSQLSGVWSPSDPDAGSVEAATANGTVTLTLDESIVYAANLTYTLTVEPMSGAVKYATATTAEGAMRSEAYTELTGGSNPAIAADVTDASGAVRTSNTNLYIKWVAEDGTVLGLQSARLVVRTQGNTPGNYDTQTRTEMIQVNRGLGRVAFYLTDGTLTVDGTEYQLEEYEGNINGYLRQNWTGSQSEYCLSLYASFYNTFGYLDENGSYMGDWYGKEAYKNVKIVLTPFEGETFSGTPTVQATYYQYNQSTGQEETVSWPVTVASATSSEIVLTCVKPELDAYSGNLQVQVTLGGKTQTLYLELSGNDYGREGEPVWADTWDEVLAALQEGKHYIGYRGTEDVVITYAFTLEPEDYVFFNGGASLTIGNGGVVTVKGSGEAAAQLDLRTSGTLTVASGGTLTSNSQDSNQQYYHTPQVHAGGVIVQSGGTLTFPNCGCMHIYTSNGVFTLEQGGKVEIDSGWLRIGRNANSEGENVFAGTVTVSGSENHWGELEVNDSLSITATGSITTSEKYVNVHIYGGLTNSGRITTGVRTSISGRTENSGTISVLANGRLEMMNTGYSVYNSGTITTASGARIIIEGTVLNNTGSISGSGTILAGEHMDLTDYENGIEYEEVNGANWTPSHYSHYKFVADPAAEVEAIYFMGEVANQAGGTCTVTIKK